MTVRIRVPSVADGARIWAIIRATPRLDLNSPYCYLLLAGHFADTCVLAESAGETIGAIVGYRKPTDPRTLFVWQVAVGAAHRGHGIGRAMLDHLVGTVAPEHVEATVGPSNQASLRMFQSLARAWGAPFESGTWLTSDDFPEPGHEAENLIRIGPLQPTRGAARYRGRFDNHARMASS